MGARPHPEAPFTRLRLHFHPQRGAVALEWGQDLDPRCLRYRGGPDSAWSVVATFEAERAADGTWHPRPGEPLPAGFAWGDASRQRFGMGGPEVAFGPLERRCRGCGDSFVFSALEQKHWLETLGFHIDSTATRCTACRKALRRVQAARRRWEAALDAAREAPDAQSQLALAQAGLALLGLGAGGRTVLERATAAARRAKRRGAEVGELLEGLRALRRGGRQSTLRAASGRRARAARRSGRAGRSLRSRRCTRRCWASARPTSPHRSNRRSPRRCRRPLRSPGRSRRGWFDSTPPSPSRARSRDARVDRLSPFRACAAACRPGVSVPGRAARTPARSRRAPG